MPLYEKPVEKPALDEKPTLVEQVLNAWDSDLAPGARSHIEMRLRMGGAPVSQRDQVAFVFDFLMDKANAHALKFKAKDPSDWSKLRSVLHRLPIRSESEEILAEQLRFRLEAPRAEASLAADGQTKIETWRDPRPGELALAALDQLERRELREHWVPGSAPAIPPWEIRVREAVQHFADQGIIKRGADLDALAQEFAGLGTQLHGPALFLAVGNALARRSDVLTIVHWRPNPDSDPKLQEPKLPGAEREQLREQSLIDNLMG